MRIPNRIAIIILVLLVLKIVSPLGTIRAYGRHWRSIAKDVQSNNLAVHIQEPRAGERDALPPKVIAMIACLRTNNITAYRYVAKERPNKTDTAVIDNTIEDFLRMEEYQRLVEGAWPARLDPGSPFLLQHASDLLPPKCRELSREGGVILARCS